MKRSMEHASWFVNVTADAIIRLMHSQRGAHVLRTSYCFGCGVCFAPAPGSSPTAVHHPRGVPTFDWARHGVTEDLFVPRQSIPMMYNFEVFICANLGAPIRKRVAFRICIGFTACHRRNHSETADIVRIEDGDGHALAFRFVCVFDGGGWVPAARKLEWPEFCDCKKQSFGKFVDHIGEQGGGWRPSPGSRQQFTPENCGLPRASEPFADIVSRRDGGDSLPAPFVAALLGGKASVDDNAGNPYVCWHAIIFSWRPQQDHEFHRSR